MTQTITRQPQNSTIREDPNEQQIEDIDIVAQVEKEIMPQPLLVAVYAEWQEIHGLKGVGDVDVLGVEAEEETGEEEGHDAAEEGEFLSRSDDLGGLPCRQQAGQPGGHLHWYRRRV
jgi:hypothetical protein